MDAQRFAPQIDERANREATKGEIDAFVHCAGTAASSRGVATVLKRHEPSIKIVVVEPAESSVLLGGAIRDLTCAGHFGRQAPGAARWHGFRDEVIETIRGRFGDPLSYTRSVVLAAGIKALGVSQTPP